MMHPKAIKDLQFIDNIKSTSNKTTAKYKNKSQHNSYKNILIVKNITLPSSIVKEELIYQQFNKFNSIKCINPIKKISVEPNKKYSSLVILQEYQLQGDLTEQIDEDYPLDYELMLNICEALRELHSNHIVHFNLKPENIFVTGNKSIKFSDTSTPYLNALFSKHSSGQSSLYLPYFELNDYYTCEKQADIWSLGLIFIQLIIHRRLQKKEVNLSGLCSIMDEIENDNVKKVLNRMCCPKEKRFNIDQLISELNLCRNSKDVIQQKQKLISITLPLFHSKDIQSIDESYRIHQQFVLKTHQFCIKLTLFQSRQQRQPILWLIINIRQKFNFSIVYQQLPYHLNKLFRNLQQLVSFIKRTKEQYFSFDVEGNLLIKMQAKQEQNQIIQQVKQSKVVQVVQKVKVVQILQIKEPQNRIQNNIQQGLESNLNFESDQQQDLIKAYEGFPQLSQQIKHIKDTIKIASNVEDPNIDLISLQYQYLGKQFTSIMSYPHAKKAYKLARKGFSKKYGTNSEKEMNLLINLAYVYAQEQSYSKAIQCYQKSIFIGKILQDFEILGTAYTNWGSISCYQKHYQISQKCYLKAIEGYKIYKPKGKQLQCLYQSLSKVHFYQQKYQLANKCIQLCLVLHTQKGQQYGIYQFNWAVNLLRLNQFQQAFSKFNYSFAQSFTLPIKKALEEIFINQCQKSKLARKHYTQITSIKTKLSQQSKNSLERLFKNL